MKVKRSCGQCGFRFGWLKVKDIETTIQAGSAVDVSARLFSRIRALRCGADCCHAYRFASAIHFRGIQRMMTSKEMRVVQTAYRRFVVPTNCRRARTPGMEAATRRHRHGRRRFTHGNAARAARFGWISHRRWSGTKPARERTLRAAPRPCWSLETQSSPNEGVGGRTLKPRFAEMFR